MDPREEARRQLAYIEAELERGQHEYPGRADMLRARRRELLERTAASGSTQDPNPPH